MGCIRLCPTIRFSVTRITGNRVIRRSGSDVDLIKSRCAGTWSSPRLCDPEDDEHTMTALVTRVKTIAKGDYPIMAPISGTRLSRAPATPAGTRAKASIEVVHYSLPKPHSQSIIRQLVRHATKGAS
jgi:hypothetical protein